MPRVKLPLPLPISRPLLAAGLGVVALAVMVVGFLYLDGAFQQDPEALLRQHGGYRITLQAHCPARLPGCDVGDLLSPLSDVLSGRIRDGLDIGDAQVRQQGSSQVVVYLPGLADPTGAVALLTTPGHLQIISTGYQQVPIGTSVAGETCSSSCDATHFPIVFDGAELDPNSVAAQPDSQSGQPIVTFAFAGTARDRFAQYTQSHIGEYLTIVLDDKVIVSSTIQSQISGEGQITGLSSMAEAQRLAAYLKDGMLPLDLTAVTVTQVAPEGA